MMPGGWHADQIGLPIAGHIDDGFNHIALADSDRERMIRLGVALYVRRIVADMQQALFNIDAGKCMGKAHDGADSSSRFRLAIDWD